MKNKSLKYLSFFILLFFAATTHAQNKNSDVEQTTEEAVEKSIITSTTDYKKSATKTVEFKIESRKPLTEEVGKAIDDLLLSKTGINSAKTDIKTGFTKVTINSNFSEKAVEQLFERVNVEAKISSVTTN